MTTTAVEKAKTGMPSKQAIANSSVPKSSKPGEEKSVASIRQRKLSLKQEKKKKKGRRPGSRGLRGIDIDNREEDGREKHSLRIGDGTVDRNRLDSMPSTDNKDERKDTGNQTDKKDSTKTAPKRVERSSDRRSEMKTKEKSQEVVLDKLPLVPPVPGMPDGEPQKLGNEGEDSKDDRENKQHSAKKDNSTAAKVPDAVCQGKLCVPAFGLLIEEGLPSNITLNQV